MSLKPRKETDSRYMWELSHIFESREAFEEAYSAAEASLVQIEDLRGKMTHDAATLKRSLDAIYEIGEKVELVYLYAFLHKESDNSDPEYQAMSGRAVNLLMSFSSAVSFMNPEILSAGKEKLEGFLCDPVLSGYRHIIEDIARGADHTLDEKGEKMRK